MPWKGSGIVRRHSADRSVFLALPCSRDWLLIPLDHGSSPHRLRCASAVMETRFLDPRFGRVQESYHWPTKYACFDPEMETAPDPDYRRWPRTWISDGLRE